MATAKATLKNYRQSPRKVRLVADAVRGKRVEEAIVVLSFMPKRSALPLKKLISSAVANFSGGAQEEMVIKEITVDAGPTLFRRRPRSRGMASPIKKRTSHVSVVLAESAPKKSVSKKANSSKLKATS